MLNDLDSKLIEGAFKENDLAREEYNSDYTLLEKTSVALEMADDLLKKDFIQLSDCEDLFCKSKELQIISKEPFEEDHISLEASHENVIKIKERILMIIRWLGKILYKSVRNLIDFLNKVNLRLTGVEKSIKNIDKNKIINGSITVQREYFPLLTTNTKESHRYFLNIKELENVDNFFNRERTQTLPALENALVNYKDRLNMFLNGTLPNVPRIDLFDIIRRTENFAGTDERISSYLEEIKFKTQIDKGREGDINITFELPPLNRFKGLNEEVEIPSAIDIKAILPRYLRIIETGRRYSDAIIISQRRYERLGEDLLAVMNSKNTANPAFQESAVTLINSRDFSQVAIFSAIKTFVMSTRINISVLNQLAYEIYIILRLATTV